MPTSADDRDPALTADERRAIEEIRRELDAEFGPLEDSPRGAPPRSEHAARARQARLAAPERASERPLRQVRPARRRGVSMFLLGALIGGLAGGVAGAATVLWFAHVNERVGAAVPGGATAPRTPSTAADQRVDRAAALDVALRDWLEATKRADIQGQMRFYPSRVPVYYTWRDVSREAVRDEKVKVFGSATRLEIATDTPTVELADGGRSAVTRFRKRYIIEGPVIRRRGEVLQELRWIRTAEGWRIVAERDAEVLAP